MKTRIEKIGMIYVEFPESKPVKKHGANHLRNLIRWMNTRPEVLNEDKSSLDLLGEYNTMLRNK